MSKIEEAVTGFQYTCYFSVGQEYGRKHSKTLS